MGVVAELCNGSTADSDSVCLGSNPSSAGRKKTNLYELVFFLISRRSMAFQPNAPLPFHFTLCFSFTFPLVCDKLTPKQVSTKPMHKKRRIHNGKDNHL